ncbi:class I adenylate-forming enzyme family protein [Leucobacter sp. Z1108]
MRSTADVAAGLGGDVALGAMRHPDRVALEMLDGPSQTYLEMDRLTNRIANALLGSGLVPGDRVAIWMGNSLEYVNTYVACLKAGLVIVQVNTRHTSREADYQLADSGAAALLFDDEVAARVEALETVEQLRLRVTTGAERVLGAQTFTEFAAVGNVSPPSSSLGPEALAVIGYTSGTTGYPKGVELTHRSIRSLGVTNALSNRYALASRQVFGLSLSFTAATPAHILPHLYVGGTTLLMRSWDTERLVAAIDAEHASFTIVPSPAVTDFTAAARRSGTRLDSMQSVLHSASKAPAEHLREFVDYFGPRLVEGWGMTENSGGLVTATTVEDFVRSNDEVFASAGRAVPGAIVRLADEHGDPLPHDGETVGQLMVHSTSLARGYWRNPAATEAAFADGWYRSGDLGTIRTDGLVTVIDRRHDLIISGGMNIYPSELERVIAELPQVREVAVVAAAHDRWGQTPVAFVSVRVGDGLDSDSVFRHCETNLARYKVPTQVHFLDQLPLNASGKVLREELRARVETTASFGPDSEHTDA